MAVTPHHEYTGIYMIRNTINNKKYIGSAVHIGNRWDRHMSDLRNDCHHSAHLQRAYNQYGKDSFEFSVIEKVSDWSHLLEKEQYWMGYYKSADRDYGYNMTPTAGSPLGFKHTEETKQKHRENMQGNKHCLGVRSGYASLTDEQVIEIKQRLINGDKQAHIANDMGVTANIVNRIHKGVTYADIKIN